MWRWKIQILTLATYLSRIEKDKVTAQISWNMYSLCSLAIVSKNMEKKTQTYFEK
jgi:hypothetical protein